MNRPISLYAAPLLGLALLSAASVSQASTLSAAPTVTAGASLSEAVGALRNRVLDASLQSSGLAGSAITDATVTPPTSVPEPETMALLGFGLAAMIGVRRRLRRAAR